MELVQAYIQLRNRTILPTGGRGSNKLLSFTVPIHSNVTSGASTDWERTGPIVGEENGPAYQHFRHTETNQIIEQQVDEETGEPIGYLPLLIEEGEESHLKKKEEFWLAMHFISCIATVVVNIFLAIFSSKYPIGFIPVIFLVWSWVMRSRIQGRLGKLIREREDREIGYLIEQSRSRETVTVRR